MLTERFGERNFAILGSLLGVAGAVFSSFATQVNNIFSLFIMKKPHVESQPVITTVHSISSLTHHSIQPIDLLRGNVNIQLASTANYLEIIYSN